MLKIRQVLSGLALVAILVLVGAVDAAFAQTPASVPVPAHRGAPGPIAGAGLPIAVIGFSAYWLMRRYRRKRQ